mmetsp:Transcript_1231/g.4040  ORF Transcript_1231/g.4040 Transcript_1231/m.4040 type:complete len:457 (+) Transcript_1231:148-1518(+)
MLVDLRVAAAAEHLLQHLVNLLVRHAGRQRLHRRAKLLERDDARRVLVEDRKHVVGQLLHRERFVRLLVHLRRHHGQELDERDGARAVRVHLGAELLRLGVAHLLAHRVEERLELGRLDVAVARRVEEAERRLELLLLRRVALEHGESVLLLVERRLRLLGRAHVGGRDAGARGGLGLQFAQLARVRLHGREELEEAEGEVELLLAERALDELGLLHHPDGLRRDEQRERGQHQREGHDDGGEREREQRRAKRRGHLLHAEHLAGKDGLQSDHVDGAREQDRAHNVAEPLRPLLLQTKGEECLVLVAPPPNRPQRVLGLRVLLAKLDLQERRGVRRRERALNPLEVAPRGVQRESAEPAPEHEEQAHAKRAEEEVRHVHQPERRRDEHPRHRVHLHNLRGNPRRALRQVGAEVESVVRVVELDLAALRALQAVHEPLAHLQEAVESRVALAQLPVR